MEKKQKLGLKEQWVTGIWEYGKDKVFIDRKKALIDRDPLKEKLLSKLRQSNLSEKDKVEINDLKQEIERKWNVSVYITAAATPHVYGLMTEDLKGLEPLLIANKYKTEPITVFRPPCEGCVIPIDANTNHLIVKIDLNLIDKKKADFVKAIWEIAKEHLNKIPKRQIKLLNETKEMIDIYKYKDETFNNYLRWYDLHMEGDYKNCKGSFNFRQIAFLQYAEGKRPGQIDKVIEGMLKRGKIGDPINGEDRVEKAVKTIYQAIHRKPYPSKLKHHPLNCPIHGKNCPQNCKNFLKEFMRRFNNRFKLKPLYTQSMESFEDSRFMKKPAKGKSAKIKGVQKMLDNIGLQYFPKLP